MKSIINEYNIQFYNIYNINKTGFFIEFIKVIYIIINKMKNIRYSGNPGRQEWVSVIECICMDGTSLPPLIIFKGKTCMGRWLPENVPNDWLFSVNSQGWTSNEHMKKWLKHDFEPHTHEKAEGRTLMPKKRPEKIGPKKGIGLSKLHLL